MLWKSTRTCCVHRVRRGTGSEMPVFEYRCTACGSELEAIVLPSEDEPSACPGCGGALSRRWSRLGVRLQGWGFARTDALLPDSRRRKPFKQIQDKASELFD